MAPGGRAGPGLFGGGGFEVNALQWMVIEEVAIPAAHFVLDEVVAGVEIERREAAFIGQDLLAALVAGGGVGGVGGLVDQSVVSGVFPAGLAVDVGLGEGAETNGT